MKKNIFWLIDLIKFGRSLSNQGRGLSFKIGAYLFAYKYKTGKAVKGVDFLDIVE